MLDVVVPVAEDTMLEAVPVCSSVDWVEEASVLEAAESVLEGEEPESVDWLDCASVEVTSPAVVDSGAEDDMLEVDPVCSSED